MDLELGGVAAGDGKESIPAPTKIAPSASVESDDAMAKKEHLDQKGPTISWRRVNFSVTQKPSGFWSKQPTDFQASTKYILRDVAGEVPAEQVCAILGPSGAGKSSLLNVLAGRSSSKPPRVRVSAKMEVDGVPTNPVAFRKHVAYVMQDDNLMPTATPREAIRFSATLRLGPEVPDGTASNPRLAPLHSNYPWFTPSLDPFPSHASRSQSMSARLGSKACWRTSN